jgi:hypothetical protein
MMDSDWQGQRIGPYIPARRINAKEIFDGL